MSENKNESYTPEVRGKVIVRTGIIGIAANVMLAAFKAFIGIASNSVAVVSDALNNLSDALSSLITIIGTKLAGKKPDKKHPLGYGRIEYMSALIVSAIVLYAGITAFIDSVKKIITPETPDYSVVSLVILGAAVVVKIVLGTYTKAKGKAVNSGSLIASGSDALNDAILSTSVLVTALVYMFFHISLEAWVGAIIALFIIKAGIEMISDAVNEMLGARADTELVKQIKAAALKVPRVHGAYDLLINNYGPDRNIASLHIEVDDVLTAREIDALSREVMAAVFHETAVIISAVGVYSVNTSDDDAAKMRDRIRSIVMSHEGVLQIHGFYVDIGKQQITFDMVLDFKVEDREKLSEKVKSEILEEYPGYDIHIALDIDASDI
ncbi:MAG: cation diffusion facilitator family transporter [Ruminiclostridium sp.]|nr:cation diffusion facilitator family transporter [Ruminiclostridium sp.]